MFTVPMVTSNEAAVQPPTVHHAPTIPGLSPAIETAASAGAGAYCHLCPTS